MSAKLGLLEEGKNVHRGYGDYPDQRQREMEIERETKNMVHKLPS